jgi:hypothetical protein
MLPVKMNTSATSSRALAHSREYLAKLLMFTFEASKAFLFSGSFAIRRPHPSIDKQFLA